MIQLRSVTKKYKNNYALKNINLDILSGEFVFITGASGAGKSTLMKMLYKEETPTTGTVLIGGINIANLPPEKVPNLRRCMGIVFQDFQLLTDRTVQKNLEFVLRATGWKDRAAIGERIQKTLRQVGMENKAYRMPHELSGGEQQRIVIARALLNSPEIILADEPTGNLDPQTGKQIVALLHEICNEGTAVIMTTHNHYLVREFPGRVLLCNEKQITDITDTVPIK